MIYERYAEVYDSSGQVHFSLRMIAYLSELLPRHRWQGTSALDLACGTGTLALAFAQQGLRAFGVDASAAMLAQARQKGRELGLEAEFSRQDMRSFSLPQQVDLVTCCYDSLNYLLTPADLDTTVARIAATLRPGGLFVFDVNSLWLYENVHEGIHFFESEGQAIVVQGTYERQTRLATAKLIGFVRRSELWERFEETHEQRAHSEEELAGALAKAGLVEEGRYTCFGFDPPRSDTTRLAWVARKK